jgi:hypothetical protein
VNLKRKWEENLFYTGAYFNTAHFRVSPELHGKVFNIQKIQSLLNGLLKIWYFIPADTALKTGTPGYCKDLAKKIKFI